MGLSDQKVGASRVTDFAELPSRHHHRLIAPIENSVFSTRLCVCIVLIRGVENAEMALSKSWKPAWNERCGCESGVPSELVQSNQARAIESGVRFGRSVMFRHRASEEIELEEMFVGRFVNSNPRFKRSFRILGRPMSSLSPTVPSSHDSDFTSPLIQSGSTPAHVTDSPNPTSSGSRTSTQKMGTKQVPRGKIMIVDDEIANVLVAKKLLNQAGYQDFETTTDSTLAMNMVHTCRPDVLLLDINMPGIDGIAILKQIRSVEYFRHLPVLILTANSESQVKLKCLELGATDFLVKPIDPMELAPRVRNALLSKMHQDQLHHHAAQLEETVRRRTHELEESRREVIYCLARAAELRDNDTGNHVIRVGRYAGIIAKHLGMPPRYVWDIELAAQLHDVGKIAIPDSILLKPGKLEPEEFDVIQQHVKHGRQIIKPYVGQDAHAMRSHVESGSAMLQDGSALMRLAACIAQTHHERFDGTGYPIGLAGEDIPLEGRITAVADVFDALSSERPYKKAMPREKCFSILEEGRGCHFDPKVLDAFFKGTSEIVRVQVEFMDCQ